jgi:hypothetical protein
MESPQRATAHRQLALPLRRPLRSTALLQDASGS